MSGKAIKIAFFQFKKSQSLFFHIERTFIPTIWHLGQGLETFNSQKQSSCNNLLETNMVDSFTIFVFCLGGEEWKLIAEKFGFTPDQIRFLDNRTRNPAEAMLEYIAYKYPHVTAGQLYDVLTACGVPVLADDL